MKRKKKRSIKLFLAILLLLSIGFALLTATLKINGIAGIKNNKWDIHWDGESIEESGKTPTTSARVKENDNHTVEFAVSFDVPGDYYEFTVDAVNEGTIDGIIKAVTIKIYDGTNNEVTPNDLSYSITYADTGEVPNTGDILKINKRKKYKVRIEYPTTIDTLPDEKEDYIAELIIDVEQHEVGKGPTLDYYVGDYTYFDPIGYQFCESKTETNNCYKWMVISKTKEELELLLASGLEEFKWTNENPADLIASKTTRWSSKIKSPASTHDITTQVNGETYTMKFSDKKARLLIDSEYYNLNNNYTTEPLFSTICTGTRCGGLTTDNNIFTIEGRNGWNTPPTYTLGSDLTSYNVILRPVIRVDNEFEKYTTKTCTDFQNDSWDTINDNVKKYPSRYPIGCTKTVNLTEDNSGHNLGTHTVRIANRGACYDGETSETTCGVVIEFADIIIGRAVNESIFRDPGTNTNGYGNVGGWEYSGIRTYVNNDIYNALPNDLKNIIKTTKVVSGHGSVNSNNFETQDKLYLLSLKEIYGTRSCRSSSCSEIEQDTAESTTRQMEYYNYLRVSNGFRYSTTAKDYNSSNSSNHWWTRTPTSIDNKTWLNVGNSTGYWGNDYVDNGTRQTFGVNQYGVSPAFRIG